MSWCCKNVIQIIVSFVYLKIEANVYQGTIYAKIEAITILMTKENRIISII
jgi:hypothetical protein